MTYGPGLNGSLLVGLSFAKAISFAQNIPLIGIDHLKAHLYAPLLCQKVGFPFVGLVVSGGHTSLFLVKDFDNFTLLGQTVDDAAGEAFDKVAKILGLSYPGGPLIEKIALRGNPKMRFSCGNLEKKFDFSFSGIKTAVLYHTKGCALCAMRYAQTTRRKTHQADIAYAFQEAVFDDIAKKSILACMKKTNSLVVGGGVASNKRLRQKLHHLASLHNIKVYLAKSEYCLDNAAMVAGLGYRLYKKGIISNLTLNTKPT